MRSVSVSPSCLSPDLSVCLPAVDPPAAAPSASPAGTKQRIFGLLGSAAGSDLARLGSARLPPPLRPAARAQPPAGLGLDSRFSPGKWTDSPAV
ncbi:hypothetical protein EPR50_G00182960 [Perca flavescens]|uniref:Uncharacterized protein n=1 Tax=Perca flavescens TaxID=8167 RepID=A0A484CI73_PERFV|nr:hypothetical protein EPR50_G00182960 [Perca flavescens]